MSAIFIKQFENLLAEFKALKSRSTYEDNIGGGDITDGEIISFNTKARAAIYRAGGETSAYGRQCNEIIKYGGFAGYIAKQLEGVVNSLYEDIKAGYLQTQSELIHGDLFADFLEMSEHLNDEGYKDAAAVIAGSSLEAHLRQLCNKSGLPVTATTLKGISPIKADKLNADLYAAGVYSLLDSKSVTAWLDLRNKAAHGHYTEYDTNQVKLMISGIRDFITRNPA